MKRARWISASLVVASLAASPHAFAQNEKAAAEALFDDAKRLMEAKRYGEACKKFADSQKLDPGVGTLLNLGRCYKENGQTASAWSTYREAAAQARAVGQPDREELARDEATALEPRLTKLVIEVGPDAAAIPGLEVKRDGGVVPQGLWGVPAPVDPGVRAIDVSAPGRKPLHLEARTEGYGATAKVVIPPLELAPAAEVVPVAAAAPPAADTPPKAAEDPGKTQRIAGFVVGGVGLVSAGVGTWFLLYANAQSEVADKAAADEDQEREERYRSDAKTSRTIGFVGIGVGAAALIGGVVLIVTAPSAPKAASITIVPELAKDGGGLSVLGTF